MKPPTFYGDVENGKLKLRSEDLFRTYIRGLSGLVSLLVQPRKKVRSLNQNNLYWVWLTVIGDEVGYSKEEVHDVFKHKYLKEYRQLVNQKTGEAVDCEFIRSTTSLNKKEMSEYMQKIDRDAAELGILLPDPAMWEDYRTEFTNKIEEIC